MRAVQRGDIYHRYFTSTNPPKNKFFVIVGEDEHNYIGYFFINSNINGFVSRNNAMTQMQMPIKPSDYPFLTHVSFVAGHDLATISKNELINDLSSGNAQFKGRMQPSDMQMLLNAALASPLFSAREKRFFQ